MLDLISFLFQTLYFHLLKTHLLILGFLATILQLQLKLTLENFSVAVVSGNSTTRSLKILIT